MASWADTHCHIGEYPNPWDAVETAADADIRVIAATTLPSEYVALRGLPATRGLGFHPLHALIDTYADEMAILRDELPTASWVSEIGLDGWLADQPGGPPLKRQQRLLEQIFAVGVGHAVLSVHSRQAERRTIDLIVAARPAGAVFHWFNGDLRAARKVIDAGMLFSINPMMLADPGRADFLLWAPTDALLLETDGPQAATGAPQASPRDIPGLAMELARRRGSHPERMRAALAANLSRLEPVAQASAAE